MCGAAGDGHAELGPGNYIVPSIHKEKTVAEEWSERRARKDYTDVNSSLLAPQLSHSSKKSPVQLVKKPSESENSQHKLALYSVFINPKEINW